MADRKMSVADRAVQRVMAKVDFCPCGRPESTWATLKMLLDRGNRDKNGWGDGNSFYDPMDGATDAWVEFAAKCIDKFGLIEHGGGIGGAWLTDEGLLLWDFLEKHGTDSDKWPEWATHDFECDCSDCTGEAR